MPIDSTIISVLWRKACFLSFFFGIISSSSSPSSSDHYHHHHSSFSAAICLHRVTISVIRRERRWAEIQCNTLWSVTQIQCNTMWHTVTLLDATYCVPIHYTPLLHSVTSQPKSMLPFTNVGIGNRANSQYLDWWCYPTIWTSNTNPFVIFYKNLIFSITIYLSCATFARKGSIE